MSKQEEKLKQHKRNRKRSIITHRKCTVCENIFPLTSEFFHKNSHHSTGFIYKCKECRHKERTKNSPSYDPFNKICPQCKKQYPRTTEYFYRHTRDGKEGLDCWCKKCVATASNRWRSNNPDKVKLIRRKAHEKRYIEKYDEILEYTNQYRQNRYRNDVEYRLGLLIRGRVKNAVNGKLRIEKTTELIGCSFAELKAHLESQFKDGMTWENYGQRGWHIDHIIPCAAFDLTDPEQQKKCFHYTNLQPMWCEENQRKTCYYNGSLYKNGIKVTQL